ncbi:MAG: TetR/AcrR family transcriptional regulator [Acidimicrobiia bacterium]|nr:TetR/AcrR family transcriptional regulator [Acidimicrobiia bacterium]
MGRRPNPQRKQDLLDEIVDYLGENGIGDLSLRPLAKRLGTSTYTLTYQFGSKDQLLADSVRHAVKLQLAAVSELTEDEATAPELVRRLWVWTTKQSNLRLVRMLLEATTLAASQPDVFGGVGNEIISGGMTLLTRAMQRAGYDEAEARRHATRAWATFVGLQVDLLATGERKRVTLAVDDLCAALEELTRSAPLVSAQRN